MGVKIIHINDCFGKHDRCGEETLAVDRDFIAPSTLYTPTNGFYVMITMVEN